MPARAAKGPDNSNSLAVPRIGSAVFRDLLFVQIADRQQHRLGVNEISALFAMIFQYACLNDGIDRTRLLAVPAKDARG